MVCEGITGNQIIKPKFLNGNITADVYLDMFESYVLQKLVESGSFLDYFQHDGAPPHFGQQVEST